jgi:hypothetical protein
MAAGAFAVAVALGVGVAGAAAAPNPGFGTGGYTIIPSVTGPPAIPAVTNNDPLLNSPYEQAEDGPQTANVPTLAWVGEDVRLVACDDDIVANPLGRDDIDFEQANWSSGTGNDLWTGDQAAAPAFDSTGSTNLYVTNTSSAFFFPPTGVDEHRNGCVSADISSVHAGLDEVSLNVTRETASERAENLDPTVVYSEQFIVIWMTANTPTITEATPQSLSFPTTAGNNVPASISQITAKPGLVNVNKFLGDAVLPGTFPSPDAWGTDTTDANDTPDTNNGLVQIRVTGSFPIEDQPPAVTNEQYFAGITGGGNPSSITLPNQWVALANLMAASSTNYQGTNAALWDIHGSPTNELSVMGHAEGIAASGSTPSSDVGGICQNDGSLFGQATDVVDDCASNGLSGNPYSFSRVFGDMTVFDTIGPYDAESPNATLLSDGQLNTDDAPMPALPVTVSLGANSIGGLYGVSKWLIYSHDFDGAGYDGNGNPIGSPLVDPPSAAGTGGGALTTTGSANLYNPFYQEYIPSTLRPISEASGVTGVYEHGQTAGSGDDFPGFSNGDTDAYTFWKALDPVSTKAKSNGCLEYDVSANGGGDQGGNEIDELKDQNPAQITTEGSPLSYYSTPNGPNSILVYTDERGEAYVDFNPGTGFYYSGGADQNGACDLQALYGKALGTAAITANAHYPYESVPYAAIPASNTLTKTVDSEWTKTLTAYPKSNLSGNEISVVVAHAQNINGEPFSGELVCIQASTNYGLQFDGPPTISKLTVTTPAIDLTGSEVEDGYQGLQSGVDCGYTGTAGNVAFDVSGSNGATNVDVQALFGPEHLYRDVNIPVLGQSTPVSSTSPPGSLPGDPVPTVSAPASSGSAGSTGTAAASTTGGGSSTSASSSVTITTASGTSNIAPLAQATIARVTMARLSHGKLELHIKSVHATATVTIKVFSKSGKLLRTLHLTLKANKTVTISVGSKAAHVAVSAR